MGRLMGRARDLVRIGLHSNPQIDTTQDPEFIFSILKQQFSKTIYSTLPLTDLYATTPEVNEKPLDYWIRLNTAVMWLKRGN